MAAWSRAVETLTNRLRSLLVKALVRDVAQGAIERMKVQTPAGLNGSVEIFDAFGFASAPLPGAEVLRGYAMGSAETPVGWCPRDSRYRPTDLQPGDAAVYNSAGDRVWLKASRELNANINGATIVATSTSIKLQVGPTSIEITPAGVTIIAPGGTTTFV